MTALKTKAPLALLVLGSLCLSVASNADAQPAQDLPLVAPPSAPLVIESATIENPDASKCVYGWTATIKNNTTKDKKVIVKASYENAPFGEQALTVPAGKSVVAKAGGMALDHASTSKFVVQVNEEGVKKAAHWLWADTPMTSYTKLEFSAKQTSATTFSWSAKNTSTFAFPASDLTFQAYVASSDAGPWTTAAGGTVGSCIAAGGSITLTPPKPASATNAQINVLKYNLPLHRKVVPITQAPSAKIAAPKGPIPQ